MPAGPNPADCNRLPAPATADTGRQKKQEARLRVESRHVIELLHQVGEER